MIRQPERAGFFFDYISHLNPIRDFISLKKLNIKSTDINSLEAIKDLSNLEELICNLTNIESLEPLIELKKLKIIQVFHTALAPKAIEAFKKKRPDCQLKETGF